MIPITLLLAVLPSVLGLNTPLLFENLKSESTISTLYTTDKKADRITNECLVEMYPRNLYTYPLNIDKNDVPCILHCVLKKFGIMTSDGKIVLKNYYRRVQQIHRYDPRILISDVGDTCAQKIKSMDLSRDVCKKAKVFNECTQLFAVSLKDPNR